LGKTAVTGVALQLADYSAICFLHLPFQLCPLQRKQTPLF